jgi:hypothetical protein
MIRVPQFILAALLLLAAPGIAAAQTPALTVASPAFTDGGMLAPANAASERDCGGGNVSPTLRWSGSPDRTKSFAIVMIDPDGRRGLGSIHWVVYGIPPSVRSLPEGAGGAPSEYLVGGTNGSGTTIYRGPCPPQGDEPHHYVFQVYALDLEPGTLQAGLTREAFLEAIRGHSLAEASIVGRYAR